MTASLMPSPTGTVTPPPAGPKQRKTLQPFRWTISQYRDLYKTGLFRDMKTMLIHGEVYAMVMPYPPHDTALGKTDDWLRSVFTNGCHVRCQMGSAIGTDSDPGPDLAVVPGSRSDYSRKTPKSAMLIVEVSDSTLSFDMTTKAELYATAGVPEYWIIDLENSLLLVHRDPVPLPEGLGATAYRTHLALKPEESIAPLAAPNATVKVADLLP